MQIHVVVGCGPPWVMQHPQVPGLVSSWPQRGREVDAALRNSPRGVDKAGGHGLSHGPKITADTKIPWDPKSGAKLVLEELSGSCLGPQLERRR